MLISTVLLLMVTFINNFFSLCGSMTNEWLIVLGVPISPLIVAEIFKFIR